MRNIITSIFILVFLSLSGCSLISSLGKQGPSKDSKKTATTQSPSIKSEISAADGIELVWKTPSEPVDGFIIRYGYNKDALNRSARLPINSLTSSQDIEFGSVYRYVIKPIEAGKIVYVALASFKGENISEFSEIYEEGPLKK